MNTANSPPSIFPGLLQRPLRCSRYAKRELEADRSLLDWLQENPTTPCNRADIRVLLQQSGHDLAEEPGLARAVRKLRKEVMVKLILRDLNGLADLNEVVQAMTALAEESMQLAQACLMEALLAQFGTPLGEASARPQELLIIGMGKLGGGELNVSSDIDLIFVYPEDGETDGSRNPRKEDAAGYPTATPLPSRRLSNHEFFTRLGRRPISLINELPADGHVFRGE